MYWEPRIKTYGIAERTGLTMTSVEVPAEAAAAWGPPPAGIRDADGWVLALAHPAGDRRTCLHLLTEAGAEAPLASLPEGRDAEQTAVAVVFWQGPHYGDRYGIATAALEGALRAELPVLAFACTGSSIYLVVPESSGRAAREAMEAVFLVPGADPEGRPS